MGEDYDIFKITFAFQRCLEVRLKPAACTLTYICRKRCWLLKFQATKAGMNFVTSQRGEMS
jgi:hypothetical protein